MSDAPYPTIDDLSPQSFENMTFDLLQQVGVRNLVWRTPGADGGRDIEGTVLATDISGHVSHQKWYIECKRYATTIDWPTVWQKVAYADNAGADFLLLVTNSNPSPNCESQIAGWNNARKRPTIRVWRGYELGHILSQHPIVGAKYGLCRATSLHGIFTEISIDLMKIVQSAHVAAELGQHILPALEVAGAISELVSFKMSALQEYGKFVTGELWNNRKYPWLQIEAEIGHLEDAFVNTLVTLLRYLTAASSIRIDACETGLKISPQDCRLSLSSSAIATIRRLAVLGGNNVTIFDNELIVLGEGDGR